MGKTEREAMRNRRKKGCAGRIFTAIIAIALIFWGAGIVTDFTGTFGRGKSYTVDIPDGAGSSSIAKILDDSGVIHSTVAFKIYSKLHKAPLYQKGKHTLSTSMSFKEITSVLASAPDFDESDCIKVLIPEGFEAYEIAKALKESGAIESEEEFIHLLDHSDFSEKFPFTLDIKRSQNRLEGYLYPATYFIPKGSTDRDIIEMMLTKFSDVVLPLYDASDTEYTLDEIVTFASIIEKEAANDDERGLIASVFKNRLDAGVGLCSCATIQYIIKERKEILSESDTAIDSPYNTYKYRDLPIGPIASPGEASVKAALNPDDTEYLYFAASADGTKNYFSKTYDEHMKKVDKIQK